VTKILIDLQACQNASRFRGLGRYARNMALEIALAGGNEVHILLNSAFPHTVLELRQRFCGLLPDENVHVVDMLDDASAQSERGQWRKSASELLREAYIEMLAPDVVFCPSFIEGFGDNLAVSLHRISTVPVAVAMHDLIPLIMREHYLAPVPDYERFYRDRIAELSRADGLIAISEQSFSEAVELLKYDPAKAVNASEGAEPVFRELHLSDGKQTELRQKFKLKRRFVFYTGGADQRKNLERLINAYASLSPDLRSQLQLVFAGSISEVETARLTEHANHRGLARDEFRMLGFVSDDELSQLYNLCTIFAFPSLHEGFGLPCLEAMQCGAATIGSNVSSLPEVLGSPEAQFDPRSERAIAAKLELLLTDETARQDLIAKGREQAKRFSWSDSARKAIEFLEKLARPSAPVETWQQTWTRLEQCQELLLAEVARLPQCAGIGGSDMAEIAQAAASNRVAIEKRQRPLALPTNPAWRVEGPFDTSYSLALVNRELAKALDGAGANVALFASEGPGDYQANPRYLTENPDVARLHQRAAHQTHFNVDVVTRNMYPPRVLDMSAPLNGLTCYAWEETGFPFAYAEAFNESLQFITVTSAHVKKVLIDAGVDVPISIVGNGVDHWQPILPDPDYSITTAAHTFLHVSSCFPRKGVDVLLDSFGRAFTAEDDVLLVIKTFPNPHNDVEAQLARLRASNPHYPAVLVINDDLSEPQLKALYQQCDTLVAPSRAEGFGLPLAEAMLSGLSVITTNWSGQLDFCTPDNAGLIDYQFDRADTHQDGKPASAWVDPDADDLASLMRARIRQSVPVVDPVPALLDTFSWANVARKTLAAANAVTVKKLVAEPRLGWVTTWRKRCGIATYSEHLLDVVGMPAVILANTDETAVEREDELVIRCWNEGKADDFADTLAAIDEHGLDTIVIQFNYGFFDLPRLARFIDTLCDAGKSVTVTLHATIDPGHDPSRKLADLAGALARCDRLLVHSINDMNRLKALGLVENVTLFPHGVLVPPHRAQPAIPANAPVRLASYGFFLPNKGLLELIEAAHLLKQQGFAFRLDLVNALFPAEVSQTLVREAKALIARHGLRQDIRLMTDFLPDSASLDYLAKAELVLYPYQQTGESASGAVRYGLAAGRPVAVTPLSIFEDVADCTFALPGTSPQDIAAGIRSITSDLRRNSAEVQGVLQRADNWRNTHAYPVLGRRLAGLLRGLHRDRLVG
jgi:glycosyltransferase involved in cell wall biosynthesis